MMKTNLFDKIIERAISIKMEAVDKLIDEVIAPLADVGNPEKLIGKLYETWLPEDLEKLITIYGTKEPNPLSNLIFRKKYAEVQELEAAEVM